MEIGMLWYDDDPKRTLEEKIARAVNFYRTKYGRDANTCYVHPSLLGDTIPEQTFRQVNVTGVKVKPNGTVIRNHMWLGVEQATPAPNLTNISTPADA